MAQVEQSPDTPATASTPEPSEDPDLPSDDGVRAYIHAVASSEAATFDRGWREWADL